MGSSYCHHHVVCRDCHLRHHAQRFDVCWFFVCSFQIKHWNKLFSEVIYQLDIHITTSFEQTHYLKEVCTLCLEGHTPGRWRFEESARDGVCWGRRAGRTRLVLETCMSSPGCDSWWGEALSAATGSETCWLWPDAQRREYFINTQWEEFTVSEYCSAYFLSTPLLLLEVLIIWQCRKCCF